MAFKLLSWRLREREKNCGWLDTWMKNITWLPPSIIKTSNGLRRTCQFIVHIKYKLIHFIICCYFDNAGILCGLDAIWKSLWRWILLWVLVCYCSVSLSLVHIMPIYLSILIHFRIVVEPSVLRVGSWQSSIMCSV